MKINKKLLLILLGSLALRLAFVKNLTPFGWDQERDILVVANMIEQKKPTLSGPVVGGDGGFLLGPLYYYVLTPAYIVMSGSPWALPATSILLDLLTILAIYYLVRRAYDKRSALIASTFWAVSWFAITSSFVSWNVMLIPIYTAIVIYSAIRFKQTSNRRWLYILTFLVGMSMHVHPSVYPITPLIIFLAWPRKFSLNTKTILLSLLSFITAISPLLIFELRHNWVNTQLFKSYITSPAIYSYSEAIFAIVTKLPLTLSLWIFGQSNTLLGLILILFLTIYFYYTKGRSKVNHYSLAIIIINILLLTVYRDPNFAEYYFLPILVPVVISLTLGLKALYEKKSILAIGAIGLIMASNFLAYKPQELRADGIKVKQEIVNVISNILPSNEVDIRYELEPGRDSGIPYLLTRQKIIVNENSPNKIILQENSDLDSTINFEEHSTKEWVHTYKILGFIVE